MAGAKPNMFIVGVAAVIIIIIVGLAYLGASQGGSQQSNNQYGSVNNPYSTSQGYLGQGYYSINGQSVYISSQDQLIAALSGQSSTQPTQGGSPAFTLQSWNVTFDGTVPAVILALNYTTNVQYPGALDFNFATPGGTMNYTDPDSPNLSKGVWLYMGAGAYQSESPLPGKYVLNVSYMGQRLFNKTFVFSGANIILVGFAISTSPNGDSPPTYTICPCALAAYNKGDLPAYTSADVYLDDMQGGIFDFSFFFSGWIMPKSCRGAVNEGGDGYDMFSPGTYLFKTDFYEPYENYTLLETSNPTTIPSALGSSAPLSYDGANCTDLGGLPGSEYVHSYP